jgi:crossover junction endodeoxyribonuclease RuvC
MPTQLIAGIDQSLTGTAICIMSNAYEIKHLVTFKLKDITGITRLHKLAKKLDSILKKHSPLESFIEGYSFMSKGRSVFNLGELGGIYRMILARKYGGYYEIPPTSLKKFITGKGNAKKQIMLEKTFRKYNVGSETLLDDNQVDAYGLARMGTSFLNWDNGKEYAFSDYEIKAFEGISDKCKIQ